MVKSSLVRSGLFVVIAVVLDLLLRSTENPSFSMV